MKRARKKPQQAGKGTAPRCGLCGKTGGLTRTECCGHWICDDESSYVMFSYARNSCSRNHGRYTLCGFHAGEEHEGRWQDCQECREQFEPEMYVYYGTNEYNFERLENPPRYEPTHCATCQRVIHLGTDGYTLKAGAYYCLKCGGLDQLLPLGPRKPRRIRTFTSRR